MTNVPDTLDPNEIQESLALIERQLLATIGQRRSGRRRRRRVIAVAAGLAIFTAGFASAAAAAAAIQANPGDGTLINSHGKVVPSDFAVDCYASKDSNSASQTLQFSKAHNAADAATNEAAETDPESVCVSLQQSSANRSALLGVVNQLVADGNSCGYVVQGESTWYFDHNASDSISLTDGTPVAPPTADCSAVRTSAPTANIAVPPHVALCERASNWVVVIPLQDSASTTGTCEQQDLQAWNG